MKKFLVLYQASQEAREEMKNSDTADQDMSPWAEREEENSESIIDFGGAVGKNIQITAAETGEAPNSLVGYSIVQGQSAEEVLDALETHPFLEMDGCYIEMVEILSNE